MVDGKKVITGTSVAVHSITKDGKYGVAKAVSIIKIGNKKNDTEVTLKKGKTAQITAIEIKKDKKIKHHRNLCSRGAFPDLSCTFCFFLCSHLFFYGFLFRRFCHNLTSYSLFSF